MSRSISSKPRAGTFFPSQSSSSSFIHRILPRTTSLSTLLPSTSVLSDSSLSRTFSTPTKKPEIHENLYTIPNILTFTRLLSTPVIAYLILNDKPYLATALLFYAGLTDLVDGWIARKYNLKSVVGTIIDPMADKFLMITLTGALAYTGAMPGPPIQ
jgi:cardiolipin synthase (CMP-forming)